MTRLGIGAYALVLIVGTASRATAREQTVESVRTMCRACMAVRPADRVTFMGDAFARGQARALHAQARLDAQGTLYWVTVAAQGFQFREYEYEEGVLPVDDRRSFQPFDGVILYAAAGEHIVFELPPEAARRLVAEQTAGRLRLRIGFLLGFEEPDSDPCLIRPGVVTVRADLAVAELTDLAGRVATRMQTERFDELLPDSSGSSSQNAAVSSRVTVAPPTIAGQGSRRAALDQYMASQGTQALAAHLASCATTAGGSRGSLVVAMQIDADGQVRSARAEVDSLANAELTRCTLDRVSSFRFPAPRGALLMSLPLMWGPIE